MAESVKETGILGLLKKAGGELLDNGGLETSGYLAYTLLVAAFPFIIFLFSCASLFSGDAAATRLVQEGMRLMPPQVRDQLWPIIGDVLAQPRPGLLTFGIAAAIWAAASGADAVRDALNRAYDVKETRNWFRRKLHSLLAVMVGAVGGLVSAGAVLLVPLVADWLGLSITLPEGFLLAINIGRYALTGGMLVGLFILMYRYLPAREARGISAWQGALLAVTLWLILAGGFSLYLQYFNSYNATYGSLGGVVILLLFLQLSALVFLFGAEYNAARARQEESPRP